MPQRPLSQEEFSRLEEWWVENAPNGLDEKGFNEGLFGHAQALERSLNGYVVAGGGPDEDATDPYVREAAELLKNTPAEQERSLTEQSARMGMIPPAPKAPPPDPRALSQMTLGNKALDFLVGPAGGSGTPVDVTMAAMPTALRVAPPIVGGITGGPRGASLGGGFGEFAAQMLEERQGKRQGINLPAIGVQAAAAAITPTRAIGKLPFIPRMLGRAAEGAALNTAAAEMYHKAETGQFAPLAEMGLPAAIGAVAGGGVGAAETVARRLPKGAVQAKVKTPPVTGTPENPDIFPPAAEPPAYQPPPGYTAWPEEARDAWTVNGKRPVAYKTETYVSGEPHRYWVRMEDGSEVSFRAEAPDDIEVTSPADVEAADAQRMPGMGAAPPKGAALPDIDAAPGSYQVASSAIGAAALYPGEFSDDPETDAAIRAGLGAVAGAGMVLSPAALANLKTIARYLASKFKGDPASFHNDFRMALRQEVGEEAAAAYGRQVDNFGRAIAVQPRGGIFSKLESDVEQLLLAPKGAPPEAQGVFKGAVRPEKFTGAYVLSRLKDSMQEAKDRGLDKFLQERGQKPVTKEEIREFLQAHRGIETSQSAPGTSVTKYSQETLEDYRTHPNSLQSGVTEDAAFVFRNPTREAALDALPTDQAALDIIRDNPPYQSHNFPAGTSDVFSHVLGQSIRPRAPRPLTEIDTYQQLEVMQEEIRMLQKRLRTGEALLTPGRFNQEVAEIRRRQVEAQRLESRLGEANDPNYLQNKIQQLDEIIAGERSTLDDLARRAEEAGDDLPDEYHRLLSELYRHGQERDQLAQRLQSRNQPSVYKLEESQSDAHQEARQLAEETGGTGYTDPVSQTQWRQEYDALLQERNTTDLELDRLHAAEVPPDDPEVAAAMDRLQRVNVELAVKESNRPAVERGTPSYLPLKKTADWTRLNMKWALTRAADNDADLFVVPNPESVPLHYRESLKAKVKAFEWTPDRSGGGTLKLITPDDDYRQISLDAGEKLEKYFPDDLAPIAAQLQERAAQASDTPTPDPVIGATFVFAPNAFDNEETGNYYPTLFTKHASGDIRSTQFDNSYQAAWDLKAIFGDEIAGALLANRARLQRESLHAEQIVADTLVDLSRTPLLGEGNPSVDEFFARELVPVPGVDIQPFLVQSGRAEAPLATGRVEMPDPRDVTVFSGGGKGKYAYYKNIVGGQLGEAAKKFGVEPTTWTPPDYGNLPDPAMPLTEEAKASLRLFGQPGYGGFESPAQLGERAKGEARGAKQDLRAELGAQGTQLPWTSELGGVDLGTAARLATIGAGGLIGAAYEDDDSKLRGALVGVAAGAVGGAALRGIIKRMPTARDMARFARFQQWPDLAMRFENPITFGQLKKGWSNLLPVVRETVGRATINHYDLKKHGPGVFDDAVNAFQRFKNRQFAIPHETVNGLKQITGPLRGPDEMEDFWEIIRLRRDIQGHMLAGTPLETNLPLQTAQQALAATEAAASPEILESVRRWKAAMRTLGQHEVRMGRMTPSTLDANDEYFPDYVASQIFAKNMIGLRVPPLGRPSFGHLQQRFGGERRTIGDFFEAASRRIADSYLNLAKDELVFSLAAKYDPRHNGTTVPPNATIQNFPGFLPFTWPPGSKTRQEYWFPEDLQRYLVSTMTPVPQAIRLYGRLFNNPFKSAVIRGSLGAYHLMNLVGDTINRFTATPIWEWYKIPSSYRSALLASYIPHVDPANLTAADRAFFGVLREPLANIPQWQHEAQVLERANVGTAAAGAEIQEQTLRDPELRRLAVKNRPVVGSDAVETAKNVGVKAAQGIRDDVNTVVAQGEVLRSFLESINRNSLYFHEMSNGNAPEVSAAISRKELVDYTDLTRFQEIYLRTLLMPFAAFYVKNLNNWVPAAEGPGSFGHRISRDFKRFIDVQAGWDAAKAASQQGGSPGDAVLAAMKGGLAGKGRGPFGRWALVLPALYGLHYWNTHYFNKLEHDLEDWERDQPHILIPYGTFPDGRMKVLYIGFSDPSNIAARALGLGGAVGRLKDAMAGRTSLGEEVRTSGEQMRELWGGLSGPPFQWGWAAATGEDLGTGRNLYPDWYPWYNTRKVKDLPGWMQSAMPFVSGETETPFTGQGHTKLGEIAKNTLFNLPPISTFNRAAREGSSPDDDVLTFLKKAAVGSMVKTVDPEERRIRSVMRLIAEGKRESEVEVARAMDTAVVHPLVEVLRKAGPAVAIQGYASLPANSRLGAAILKAAQELAREDATWLGPSKQIQIMAQHPGKLEVPFIAEKFKKRLAEPGEWEK